MITYMKNTYIQTDIQGILTYKYTRHNHIRTYTDRHLGHTHIRTDTKDMHTYGVTLVADHSAD